MPQTKFSKPPVNELVFNLSFSSTGFQVAHLGSFWDTVKNNYPITSTHQPILNSISIDEAYPIIPRAWFEDESKNYLIQLQSDKFVFNWRQIKTSDKYPEFDNILPRFSSLVDIFTNWANKNLSHFKFQKYELSYINHLDDISGWKSSTDTFKLIKFFDPQLGSKRVKLMSGTINYESSEPGTSIIIGLKQGIKSTDKKPVAVFELGASKISDGTDINTWFEKANEILNTEFLDLTTDEVKKSWRVT